MFCIKFDWFWLFSCMPNSKVRVYFCFVVLLGSNLCSRNSNGLKFHWFFKSSSTKYLSPIGKLSDLTHFKTKVFKNVWLLQHLSCRKRLGTVVLQQRAQQFIFYRNIPLFHTVQEYIVVCMRKCRWLGQKRGWQISFFEGVRQISDPCKKLKTADGLQEMF